MNLRTYSRPLCKFRISELNNSRWERVKYLINTHTNIYVVGSKCFRPDIQKLCQMENAVRDI